MTSRSFVLCAALLLAVGTAHAFVRSKPRRLVVPVGPHQGIGPDVPVVVDYFVRRARPDHGHSHDSLGQIVFVIDGPSNPQLGHSFELIHGEAPTSFSGGPFIGRRLGFSWADQRPPPPFDFTVEVWALDVFGRRSSVATRVHVTNDGREKPDLARIQALANADYAELGALFLATLGLGLVCRVCWPTATGPRPRRRPRYARSKFPPRP